MPRQSRKKSSTGIYHVMLRGINKQDIFEEGYCQAERYVYDASQDEFTFCYYDRDHLGNIRQVTEADGSSVGNVIQKVNYYPFGAEFCDGSASYTSIQPYKYNGKEFDGMHGLNTYDYGARQYNPVTAHWDRVDPLCEKYYSLSPYNYCGNNPVNAIDTKGDSICVLNYGHGFKQHLAILIQNDEGKWSYYSFNGIKIYNLTSERFGGAPHNNLGEKSFDSPADFLNNMYNRDGSKDDIRHDRINGYGYTEGYILPTTPEEDKIIKENFVKAVNEGYDLRNNQCANAVQKALNSVGIKTTTINYFNYTTSSGAVFPVSPHYTEENPYLPSSAFEAIRENNPNGIYIEK